MTTGLESNEAVIIYKDDGIYIDTVSSESAGVRPVHNVRVLPGQSSHILLTQRYNFILERKKNLKKKTNSK